MTILHKGHTKNKGVNYEAHTGVTGLTRELSFPAEMGLNVPLFPEFLSRSCAPQVGVVERLNASPSICLIARTMMSRLLLGLGEVTAICCLETVRGLLFLYSTSSSSLSSSSEGVLSFISCWYLACKDSLKARSRSSSALVASSSFWAVKICSSSRAAAFSSSKHMGLVALLTLFSASMSP